jgi:hypothetical protein
MQLKSLGSEAMPRLQTDREGNSYNLKTVGQK